jgi:hypothetical protein
MSVISRYMDFPQHTFCLLSDLKMLLTPLNVMHSYRLVTPSSAQHILKNIDTRRNLYVLGLPFSLTK